MKIISLIFSLSMLALICSCNATKKATSATTNSSTIKSDQSPYDLMVGSFNSAAQAKRDTLFYDITLHMYPIWQDKPGNYLYVEQSLTAMQDKPYRQRIYQINALPDGRFESVVYALQDEKTHIGKWQTPEYFDQFDASILKLREGCAVYLKQVGKHKFEGSTNEKDCGSTLRGATYATSVVRVEKKKIVSWDQGFNRQDKQVWGAKTEGYIFDRIKYQ